MSTAVVAADDADYRPALTEAIDTHIAPAATDVDHTGAFPRDGIRALGRAGLLGLTSAPEVGGRGGSLADAADVLEHLARVDGSTAMVVLMHYSGTAALEVHGPRGTREAIAAGEHLTTLALSERGSRSHFWTPVSTATPTGDEVRLDAMKSWVTSAGEADSYVWSSRPAAADGPMTLWLVPADTPGVTVAGEFDGFGLRGNASRPMTADGAVVPASARLGQDGGGLDIALQSVLPTFLLGNAAVSLGVMEALVAEAATHLSTTRLEHLEQSVAEQQPSRLAYSQLRTRVDQTRTFLSDTLTALSTGRDDATLRVLQVKAVAAEAAAEVADGVMRLCGGAAFRKELGIERRFRDAMAARVMAPTTDALYDFAGRAMLDLPLFGGA